MRNFAGLEGAIQSGFGVKGHPRLSDDKLGSGLYWA